MCSRGGSGGGKERGREGGGVVGPGHEHHNGDQGTPGPEGAPESLPPGPQIQAVVASDPHDIQTTYRAK